ncbi:Sigma-24 [uncultured Ruminococcus sp.]|jgi:RNA polymerase sigma factor (sigma-70 family)|uniref:leucine-rich repeat protein n=3 Tax=Pseudoruminococcus massiliensis TaxID=2086583 RepID=UPI0008226BB6|nr:Sigma-24 [uncultured Ruminococcus sp.]SCJ26673.1 Sigma-24 [uncultured Ruminococcus sp.]
MNNYFSRYVHGALSGDKTAYETLYNLTKDALFFAILNITKNEQEAISIMKESYTNAFENLTSLKKPEIFDVWLNRIASYSAYISITEKNPDAFNNVAEKFEWNDEDNFDQLPQETIDDKDTRNVVKGIIENLPDDQRLLIIMHYYQEMSLSAIVSTLDLPENTVMCILSYARDGIKKEIAKAESEGRLMRSVSLGAVPFTLMELAKSQFLFHPAPPMSSIITPPTNAEPIIEEKNDIQAILNIPSPDAPKEQAQETKITEQVQEPVQQEYANPYEQAQQPVQQEYANPYEQAQQPVQQEYANPYEQAQQPVQQEYANPYEQAQQPVQQEYANPYEQAQQPVQQEYANPYEQAQQPVQQEYSNPYEQAQQPVQQETVVEQSQNVQEVSEQPSNNIPKKPQSYQRVVEANFSIDNATKQKNKKTDKQNSSLSKIGNFFKSTAGIATIIGVAFVVIAGVVIFSMLDVAKKNSLSTDGIIENSVDINASSDSESSHEPTAEELRAAELKEDEKNYVYKEYQNDTLHIVGYKGKLEDLVIPEKYSNKVITGIDPMAFSGCSQIKSVTISKNIQSISLNNRSCNMNPFYDCIYMKNIYVDEDNRYFTSVDGVLYNKSKTELLFYPSYKSDSSYTILDSVTKIEVGAFQRNGIVTEVILPKNIKTISKEAFLECTSLQKIEIPSGITEISESLFSGCKSLNDITLPNTIKEIKSNAFYKCSGLRKITLPESVETLNFLAFGDCTMLNTCTIENSNMKFKSSYDKNESIFPNTQVTLRAKKGSTTEAYAKKWKMYFSYM